MMRRVERVAHDMEEEEEVAAAITTHRQNFDEHWKLFFQILDRTHPHLGTQANTTPPANTRTVLEHTQTHARHRDAYRVLKHQPTH